jgi:spore coat polysaccharide biosynthesis protein SpsF
MTSCAILLQARMGSTRLPGKVLKTVLGKPLLGYAVERLQQVSQAAEVWVLTSRLAMDDPIERWCAEQGISCYRGSEEDVLDRYYQASCLIQSDWILRVTGDCPLIDPLVIDDMIQAFRTAHDLERQSKVSTPAPDYLSNTLERTYPRGLDAELMTRAALESAWLEAIDPQEREHVTPFIYRRPERFRLIQYRQATDLSHLRWTVDTPEDFRLVEAILTALAPIKPDFRQSDIIALLQRHPNWSSWNAHIEQVHIQR